MKTIEELYNEVMASNELKKEFCSLKSEEVEGFAAKHGCKATLAEIKAFLAEKTTASGELSDAEIEQAAGGKSADFVEGIFSAVTVGLACALTAIVSVSVGDCGTAIEGDKMLCEG